VTANMAGNALCEETLYPREDLGAAAPMVASMGTATGAGADCVRSREAAVLPFIPHEWCIGGRGNRDHRKFRTFQ
jgi:hypothetical protein